MNVRRSFALAVSAAVVVVAAIVGSRVVSERPADTVIAAGVVN
jgi:hypothetical protein